MRWLLMVFETEILNSIEKLLFYYFEKERKSKKNSTQYAFLYLNKKKFWTKKIFFLKWILWILFIGCNFFLCLWRSVVVLVAVWRWFGTVYILIFLKYTSLHFEISGILSSQNIDLHQHYCKPNILSSSKIIINYIWFLDQRWFHRYFWVSLNFKINFFRN